MKQQAHRKRNTVWQALPGILIPVLAFVCVIFFFICPVCAEDLSGEEETVLADADLESVSVDDGADSDALLEGYLNQEAGIRASSANGRRRSPRKKTLTAINRLLYEGLKDQVTSVANGESASTEFTVIISDEEFESAVGSTNYTKNDLLAYGLTETDTLTERVFEAGEDGKEEQNGVKGSYKLVVTKAAAAAMTSLYEAKYGSRTTVVNALLTDLPYELYWFDKVTGYTYASRPSIKGSEKEGLHFVNSKEKFSLAVSGDYLDQNSSEPYTVDLAKTQSIQTAINTAKSRAEEYASYGDYDKLKAFFTYVKGASAYNSDASKSSYKGGYGDPWQIIYVFDGDPSTKVVCEGYSKAFQYLFNMSTFESGTIDSNIVTGTMNHGTGEGLHMWNIVTMEDGNNYLVDVTNGRFLVGASGSVSTLYKISTGTQYTYDSDTLSQYTEKELTLSESGYNAPTGIALTYGEQTVSTEETLSVTVEKDSDFTLAAETLPETASDRMVKWASSDPVVASVDQNGKVTAIAEGTTAITARAAGNTSVKAECKVTVTDHDWEETEITAATCTAKGVKTYTCRVCGKTKTEEIRETDHDWDEGVVTTAAGCVTAGVRTYTCKRCGTEKTESIAPTGIHTFGEWMTVSAATTSAPEKQKRVCAVCGAVETRDAGVKLSAEGSISDPASVAGSEYAITTSAGGEAPAGAAFRELALRVSGTKKTSIKIKWNSVSGASGYIVYGAKCGKKMKRLGKTTAGSYTDRGLKRGTYYKYIVTAYTVQADGTEKVISTSKTIHVVTAGTKYANCKSVKIFKKAKTLKVRKKYKISAVLQKKSGKKMKIHRKLSYESSDTDVAAVSSSGRVKAVSKGKCTVYVYAQDGTFKTVKITVK